MNEAYLDGCGFVKVSGVPSTSRIRFDKIYNGYGSNNSFKFNPGAPGRINFDTKLFQIIFSPNS